MKMSEVIDRMVAKVLNLAVAAAATLVVTPALFADPPTISEIPDYKIGYYRPYTLYFDVNDDVTPPEDLLVTAESSNTDLISNGLLSLESLLARRALTVTPEANQFGTTQITVKVTDGDGETAIQPFLIKVASEQLDTGLQTEAGGLGLIATVIEYDPADPLQLTESMGEFSGPFEVYSSLDLGGLSVDLSGVGNFYALLNTRLINGPNGAVAVDAEVGLNLESLNKYLFAYFQASNLRNWWSEQGPPPDPISPEVGSDFEGAVFRFIDSYLDSQSVVNQDSILVNSAWQYQLRQFSSPGVPLANTPAIGLIYRDSVSNAIEAGDSVPPRSVAPPPNTGDTFTSFDPGGISINSRYVAFYGKGDLFSGIYTRRLSDSELFAAVESFTFQQGDLGFIWGAFLAGERDIFFNADAGVYHADAEGATPAELVLPIGTEYEPGKVFASGNLFHLAGNYGVIAGQDGNFKSTIFRLNLTDFSLEQIVQQGDAAPGGGTFSVVSSPKISDAMVVFDGFDENFKYLGLFAYLLQTQELKAVVRVGEIIDGKEVRTLGSVPGALDGPVLGFTAYFTDNSSAAYLTTSVASFTVPFGNISTRLTVGTGDDAGIGGFINTLRPDIQNAPGNVGAKQVVIRAIGPSLGVFGVAGALADPVLELRDAAGALIISNDNWRDTQEEELMESGLAPSDDLESAILTSIEPGAYTAIVRGNNGSTGVGLVEIYDLDGAAVSELGNISTRGSVQTGDGVMIGGVIVGGSEGTASTMVVRAIGPSLTAFGVANALQDPILELHDGSGALIASNDNWKETQQSELEATGLAPTNDSEAALEAALGPGLYTAIVRGAGDTSGVALVEAYNLEASAGSAAFPVSLTNLR